MDDEHQLESIGIHQFHKVKLSQIFLIKNHLFHKVKFYILHM